MARIPGKMITPVTAAMTTQPPTTAPIIISSERCGSGPVTPNPYMRHVPRAPSNCCAFATLLPRRLAMGWGKFEFFDINRIVGPASASLDNADSTFARRTLIRGTGRVFAYAIVRTYEDRCQ